MIHLCAEILNATHTKKDIVNFSGGAMVNCLGGCDWKKKMIERRVYIIYRYFFSK
jgi:hypothetical protein